MKIALCMLVRNEAECLRLIMDKVKAEAERQNFHSIYAIDGGSTDGSVEVLKSFGIDVVHQKTRGRGAAFHQAIQEIDVDAYIFFSPDGNEDEKDFSRIKKLLEEGHRIVIGSRMCRGGKNEEDVYWFRPRKWVNNVFNLLANVLFRREGPYVTDSINGYRALTREAARDMRLTANDYTIEYQMTIRAFKRRIPIKEFPTHEGPRLAGATGAPSFKTGLQFIRRLWLEILGRD